MYFGRAATLPVTPEDGLPLPLSTVAYGSTATIPDMADADVQSSLKELVLARRINEIDTPEMEEAKQAFYNSLQHYYDECGDYL